MKVLTTRRAVEPGEPEMACGLAGRGEPQPADPSPARAGGVPLPRLTALARLTAPQALEIGAGVLAEAARRAEPDTAAADDRVLIDRVVIGADGQVGLDPVVDHGHDGRPASAGPSGPAVAAVLADLAAAARRRAGRADPVAGELVAALDRAVTDVPVAGARAVAPRLAEAADAMDRDAVRAELAALVRAVGGGAGPAGGTRPAGGPSRTAPARRATERRNRTARRRIGAWLTSVLVLSAVVLLEVFLLRDSIRTDIGELLKAGAGRSGSESSAAPRPDGLPIAVPAPPAAGSVAAVDLRALASCRPGAPCAVRLQVLLVPGVRAQVVTWSYRLVDRCTGGSTTARGGKVIVPARGRRAAAVGTVALPRVPAVAVIAVTATPAVAAAPPVLVGACSSVAPAE